MKTGRLRLLNLVLIAALALSLVAFVQPTRVRAAAPTELFLSEYIEGSSNNKALEIYNGTGAPIDLAAGIYNVQMFFNGSASAGLTINLIGTVAAGDVFVLAQSSADAAILAQADQINGAGWFNGDDAVVLRKGTTIIDVIGQIGFDPGTEWGTGLTSTADNTLRRKTSIHAGDTTGSDAFNPSVEWDGFATDTFGGLGSHTIMDVDVAPTVASTTPAGGATNVLLTDNINVTFSEPVNVSGNWFQIVCPSATYNVADSAVTGGPTTFTIDPNTDFANSEPCTLTVFSAQVADQDTNDPPDTMAANYVTSFTTIGVADTAPTVSSVSPADGVTNVAQNANIVVTFSEPVNVAASATMLACPTGTVVASNAAAANVTSVTIDPAADLPANTVCQITVTGSGVTDVDANDPPDTMSADFSASFTTALPICEQPYTHIPAIQGSGATVTLTGMQTTQGVVVGDFEGASPALRGFFIQDPDGDGNPATSDGIFVFEGNNANTVSLGDVVRVTGTAGENQGQSQISVGTIVKCGTGSVNPTDVTFPVASSTFLEQYEGMLVRLPQTMYVTEHFQLGRFGQVVLSSGGKLKQPTNVVAPGAPALALQDQNNLNKIILDDASQTQNPDPILFGRNGNPLSASNTLRGGDTAAGIVGVMTYTWAGNAASGNAYRVRPINALGGYANFEPTNPRPTTAPVVGGTLKVVGMNLLNYFNTFDGLPDTVDNCTLGVGGAATDCRGADTQAEFDRQSPKTVAAILAMNPDVLGVNEIENDGYGPTSAITALVEKLNAATVPGAYAFIDVDAATGQVNALGTDAIKVGMIYKLASVTPVGQTAALNSVAFVNGGDGDPRSRPSLAQAFQQNVNGARFIVDTNHLKSKGSACDAPDAGDGQGNCNQVRVNAVTELMNWLATDPTGTGDPDILMIGDYNSYAMEDPITTIKNAGFTNLIASFLGPDAYSYVFDGQWGYLDHSLGSASIVSQVTGVGDYHINADEPSVLDYNTDFKTPNLQSTLYAPDQFRVSDHDPVVIGLCQPPSLGVSLSTDSLWPANHKYVTVEATFNQSGDTGSVKLISVTSNEPDNGLGDGDTPNDIVIVDDDTLQLRAERSGMGTGRIYTITYQAKDDCGSSIATATVTVPHDQGK